MPPGFSFDEASFAKVVGRYKGASPRVAAVQKGLVLWATQQAIAEAKYQLTKMVYSVEPGQGAVHGNRGGFRGATSRTGNTLRAVTRKGAVVYVKGLGASGSIHVDKEVANRRGFYYPAVLNRGRTDIRYAPRPFWTVTKALMRARYRMRGRAALKELKQSLRID